MTQRPRWFSESVEHLTDSTVRVIDNTMITLDPGQPESRMCI